MSKNACWLKTQVREVCNPGTLCRRKSRTPLRVQSWWRTKRYPKIFFPCYSEFYTIPSLSNNVHPYRAPTLSLSNNSGKPLASKSPRDILPRLPHSITWDIPDFLLTLVEVSLLNNQVLKDNLTSNISTPMLEGNWE